MPTAAKLFCAVCLAMTAFFAAQLVIQNLPESTQLGYFLPITVAIAAYCGWKIVGRRAGGGLAHGISNGLTGAVATVLLSLAVFSIVEMFELSLRRRYDNIIEAIGGAISIGSDHALALAHAPVIGTLALGAAITGIVGEIAQRRWR